MLMEITVEPHPEAAIIIPNQWLYMLYKVRHHWIGALIQSTFTIIFLYLNVVSTGLGDLTALIQSFKITKMWCYGDLRRCKHHVLYLLKIHHSFVKFLLGHNVAICVGYPPTDTDPAKQRLWNNFPLYYQNSDKLKNRTPSLQRVI